MAHPTRINPLLAAIETKKEDVLKSYLENGGDPDYCIFQDDSLINVAIEEAAHWAVKLLIKHNVALDKRDFYGVSPLSKCVDVGDITTLKLLLKAGADPDRVDGDGRTVMLRAVIQGKNKELRTLLMHGADLSKIQNCVWQHAKKDTVFATLMRHGADTNVQCTLGLTPLHHAAMNGLDNALTHLTKRYMVDLNTQDIKGETALMWAAKRGKTRCCEKLLKLGADFETRNLDGKKAVDMMNRGQHFQEQDFQDLKNIFAKATRDTLGQHLAPLKRITIKKSNNTKF